MKNIRIFLAGNFPSLKVKFSVYLNRRVFVMEYERTNQNYRVSGDQSDFTQHVQLKVRLLIISNMKQGLFPKNG